MNRRGFTLLEILVAIVILAIAMGVAWQTLAGATRAWTSARQMLDQTHHGDFALTQLSAALRSMVFFDSQPERYGFRMERNSEGMGEQTISWVTASRAFLPNGTEFQNGLHRIEIGAGRDDEGHEGLKVSVWRHLAPDEERVEKQSWIISEVVQGLRCAVYDPESEQWDTQWEQTNAIPSLLEITLYAAAPDPTDDPIEYRQLIEIPIGRPITNRVESAIN